VCRACVGPGVRAAACAHAPTPLPLSPCTHSCMHAMHHVCVIHMQGLHELWGEGSSWDELVAAIQAYPDHLKAPWFSTDLTFKVRVLTRAA